MTTFEQATKFMIKQVLDSFADKMYQRELEEIHKEEFQEKLEDLLK